MTCAPVAFLLISGLLTVSSHRLLNERLKENATAQASTDDTDKGRNVQQLAGQMSNVYSYMSQMFAKVAGAAGINDCCVPAYHEDINKHEVDLGPVEGTPARPPSDDDCREKYMKAANEEVNEDEVLMKVNEDDEGGYVVMKPSGGRSIKILGNQVHTAPPGIEAGPGNATTPGEAPHFCQLTYLTYPDSKSPPRPLPRRLSRQTSWKSLPFVGQVGNQCEELAGPEADMGESGWGAVWQKWYDMDYCRQ